MADVPTYPKLREDITFSRVVMRGKETFIAKDPVRRKYMQFDRLGIRFCELCDGNHSLEDIENQLGRDFPDWDFDIEYVSEYIEHLTEMRLIFRDRFEYNVLLMEKVRREREKARISPGWFMSLAKLTWSSGWIGLRKNQRFCKIPSASSSPCRWPFTKARGKVDALPTVD